MVVVKLAGLKKACTRLSPNLNHMEIRADVLPKSCIVSTDGNLSLFIRVSNVRLRRFQCVNHAKKRYEAAMQFNSKDDYDTLTQAVDNVCQQLVNYTVTNTVFDYGPSNQWCTVQCYDPFGAPGLVTFSPHSSSRMAANTYFERNFEVSCTSCIVHVVLYPSIRDKQHHVRVAVHLDQVLVDHADVLNPCEFKPHLFTDDASDVSSTRMSSDSCGTSS